MTRKSESLTISISQEQVGALENLALELGTTWGGKPNVSKLVREIADGEIKLSKGQKQITSRRIRGIEKARDLLNKFLEE